MNLQPLKYIRGSKFEIIDQLLLPCNTVYVPIRNTEDGWRAIRSMQVRGAPAIAVVGVLSLAIELHDKQFQSCDELICSVREKLDYLVTARPTAVNMADARNMLVSLMESWKKDESLLPEDMKLRLIEAIENIHKDDIVTNKAIGKHGAGDIVRRTSSDAVTVLTHCNTGSLATAGYGTALGVVRYLYQMGRLKQCYFSETRPYNQGARLTAYELVADEIPSTMICDSMVAMTMKQRRIDVVVVGADRVVANGDTANKIGTYQIAICAKHHSVPFYIAAPSTTIDLNLATGSDIRIEERPDTEMLCVEGVRVAADGVKCWNPAFDVTPAELITGGIITEYGVFEARNVKNCLTDAVRSAKNAKNA